MWVPVNTKLPPCFQGPGYLCLCRMSTSVAITDWQHLQNFDSSRSEEVDVDDELVGVHSRYADLLLLESCEAGLEGIDPNWEFVCGKNVNVGSSLLDENEDIWKSIQRNVGGSSFQTQKSNFLEIDANLEVVHDFINSKLLLTLHNIS